MARKWTRILLVALLAGCVSKPVGAPSSDAITGTVSTKAKVRYAALTGVAHAPASLLANNSGGLVANNSSGVISNQGAAVVSNHGGTFRLAAASEAWAPVALAQVVALDARRRPIPGVKPVMTDANGLFKLEDVPATTVVTIEITAGAAKLTGLARADGLKAEINPATTLATEHIRDRFEGNEEALSHVPLEQFRLLTTSVQTVLEAEPVAVAAAIATPAEASNAFDELAAKHPELREQERTVAKAANLELVKAVQAGDEPKPSALPTAADPTPMPTLPSPGPAATPSPGGPVPTPTPTPAGEHGGSATPTPAPSADGSPRPSAEPTPTPTPQATATPNGGPPPSGEAARNQLLQTKACVACDLTDQDVYNKHLEGADLHGAKLVGLDAHRTHFNGANLSGADLTGADLHGADFTGANLRGATLRNCDLHDAKLGGADLTGAVLEGASLDLDDANFAGATWTDGHTCGTPSSGACN